MTQLMQHDAAEDRHDEAHALEHHGPRLAGPDAHVDDPADQQPERPVNEDADAGERSDPE